MTPQEKAKELVESFIDALTVKDCALIAVDVILKDCPFDIIKLQYWQKVKKEIDLI